MSAVAKRPSKPELPPPVVYEPPAFPETPQRKPRKTLAEMAADGSGLAGIVCDNCKGNNWEVYYTRSKIGRIVRVRICKKCLAKVTTYERKIG